MERNNKGKSEVNETNNTSSSIDPTPPPPYTNAIPDLV